MCVCVSVCVGRGGHAGVVESVFGRSSKYGARRVTLNLDPCQRRGSGSTASRAGAVEGGMWKVA